MRSPRNHLTSTVASGSGTPSWAFPGHPHSLPSHRPLQPQSWGPLGVCLRLCFCHSTSTQQIFRHPITPGTGGNQGQAVDKHPNQKKVCSGGKFKDSTTGWCAQELPSNWSEKPQPWKAGECPVSPHQPATLGSSLPRAPTLAASPSGAAWPVSPRMRMEALISQQTTHTPCYPLCQTLKTQP